MSLTSASFAVAEDNVIEMQDAWTYMRNHTTGEGYSNFIQDFGTKEGDITNILKCGEELCNLNTSVCLYKTRKSGKTTRYRYICVPQEKVNESLASGWQEVNYDTHQNVKRIRVGNKKVKSKIYESGDCYEARDQEGLVVKYCATAINDKVEIRSGRRKGKGCEVIPVSWYNNQQCRFCPLLGPVFKTADYMANLSQETLASSFAILIVVGMAIWIAMKTLIFVSSLTKQDAAKYITEMIRQSYKFVIAFFLLANYQSAFDYIINPLLNAGLQFGTTFVEIISVEDRFGISSVSKAAFESLGGNLQPDYALNLNNKYYNISTYATLENLAYNVNRQYALLQSVGSGLNCLGWKYILLQLGFDNWQLGLGFGCVIYGIFFSCFGFLLSLAFIFYIFDAVVQLGIVGALLPFLIASWPFKITSKYTSTGFKLLLNSIFTFMMIGLVVKISIALIYKAVSLNISEDSGNSGTGLIRLIDAIDRIDTPKLKIMVNILSVGFLLFMFANILGFLLLARVSELVNRFASGGMKPAAPYLPTAGASAIKGMAAKVTAPTREAVEDWWDKKAKKMTDKAVGFVTLRPVRRGIYNAINNAIARRRAGSNTASGGSTPTSANAQSTTPNSKQKTTLGKGGKPNNLQQNRATLGRSRHGSVSSQTGDAGQNAGQVMDTNQVVSGQSAPQSTSPHKTTLGRRMSKKDLDEIK